GRRRREHRANLHGLKGDKLMRCRRIIATCAMFASSAQAAPKMVQRVYTVADIVVPEKAGKMTEEDILLLLITQTGPHGSWKENGGLGTAQYFPLGMAVVVTQTEEGHRYVADLLDALRRGDRVKFLGIEQPIRR